MGLRNALATFHGESGPREQTVLTGEPITDLLRAYWGQTDLDPCAGPSGPIWVPCNKCKDLGCLQGSIQCDTIEPSKAIRRPDDGLSEPWKDKTFCNPPYNDLKPWLLKPVNQAHRTLWYVPVRPNRKWWRSWARDCRVVVYLNPQRFKGHSQVYPAPLCFGYSGPDDKGLLANLCQTRGLGDPV